MFFYFVCYIVQLTAFAMYLLLLLFISYLCGYCDSQGAMEVPKEDVYGLNFESAITVCEDEQSQKFGDMSMVEAMRYNDSTAMLNGTAKINVDIVQGTMMEVKVVKSSRGRQEMVFSDVICDICEELEKEDSPYIPYLLYLGIPPECPIAAGAYGMNNVMADMSGIPINGANSGQYTMNMTMSKNSDGSCKNSEFIACLWLAVVIELI